MSIKRDILIVAISLIFGVLLACIFIPFTFDKQSILQPMQAIGSIGIMLGAFIALYNYRLNVDSREEDDKIAKSKINLDLALEFLKHAYETLTNNNPSRVPINDRVLWLTCARQLLASKKFSEKISYDEHKYIYDEYEDYWRTKLFLFLEKHKKALDKRYFAEKAEHALSTPADERQPLNAKSLAVVFRFIEWDKSREDKVRSIEELSEKEIDNHKVFGFEGLADHFLEFQDHMESIRNKKA